MLDTGKKEIGRRVHTLDTAPEALSQISFAAAVREKVLVDSACAASVSSDNSVLPFLTRQ